MQGQGAGGQVPGVLGDKVEAPADVGRAEEGAALQQALRLRLRLRLRDRPVTAPQVRMLGCLSRYAKLCQFPSF